jgi:hypothetical protein
MLTVGKAPEGRPHGRQLPHNHHPGGVDLYIFHLYLIELVNVIGERWRKCRKNYLPQLSFTSIALIQCVLSVKHSKVKANPILHL